MSKLLPVLAILGLAACAHDAAPARAAAAPKRAIVTGSRIPQRVDPITGIPAANQELLIYSRDGLLRTGTADLATAIGHTPAQLSLVPDQSAGTNREPGKTTTPPETPLPDEHVLPDIHQPHS